MHARRALMYMPGHDRRKIEKAIALQVDTICMDIEDGVAANRKADARQGIAAALAELDFGRSEKLVRINPVQSGLAEDDLGAVLPHHPYGIVVPKIQSVADVHWVEARLEQAERQHGWEAGSLILIVLIETPLAVIHLNEICQSSERLQALIFGADDLAAWMQATRTPAAWEVFYARGAVALHAAAYGLQSIDMVKIDFNDTEGLRQEARMGAEMGYTGKQIIHPNQWPLTAEAFTPSPAQIEEAQRLLDTFDQESSQGRGAYAVEGRMVDMPLIRAARNVIERANAAR